MGGVLINRGALNYLSMKKGLSGVGVDVDVDVGAGGY